MMLSAIWRIAAAAALVTAAGVVTTAAAASATLASQPQHRQLATTTLSDFRVVLTATQESGDSLQATVTATGYRRSGNHWTPIARKQIGKANGWFWHSVQACSLTTTQLKNNVSSSPPVVTSDSIKASLLISPAIGCSRTYSEHWTP